MSAVTASVAGPMLADLDGIFGPLRTPFSREDEPLGRALAAAWRAGDWSEAFEFAAMALVARYNGAITVHVPWEWHEFETPPPRLAWMKDGQVFVRAPHEDAYTAEAEAMRGRWHGEPELRTWSFRPSMDLWAWLERWKIMPADAVDLACRRRAISPPANISPPKPALDLGTPDPPPPPPPATMVEVDENDWRLDNATMRLAPWCKAVPGIQKIVGTKAPKAGSELHLIIDPDRDPYEWVVEGVELGVQGLDEWLAELELARRPAPLDPGTTDASRALAPSPGFQLRPGLAVKLKPHQLAGVEYVTEIATMPGRCLIGDDMGLGKSLIATASIHQMQAYPALVVCPASVVMNWAKEIRKALPDATVDACTTRSGAPGVAQWTIIGYEALQKRLAAFERTPWGSITVDEAHYIKNGGTNRGIATKMVADGVDGMRLAMTGTFAKNSDKDTLHPVKVIGREDVAEMIRKDLAEQSSILRANCMVRRKKLDVMPDLPPLEITKTYVEPDPVIWKEYLKAENDIIAYVKERARKIAAELGLDPDAEAVKAALKAQGAEHLVAISHLRQLCAAAKMKTAIEAVRSFVAQTDQSIIVFAHHRDIVQGLANALKCEAMMGGVSMKDRDRIVEDFQAKKTRAVVINFESGGVGLTLTAATEMKLVELQWTPADMDQAYGRCIVEGVNIVTRKGVLPIEAIEVGDEVLTHRGNWQRVETRTSKLAPRWVELNVTRQSEPLRCTPEHLVWTKDMITGEIDWKRADEIGTSDLLALPRPRSGELRSIAIPDDVRLPPRQVDCLGCGKARPIVTHGLCNACRLSFRKKGQPYPEEYESGGEKKALRITVDTLTLTPSLLRAFGRWLGDGWLGRTGEQGIYRRVGLCGHANEAVDVTRDLNVIADAFGIPRVAAQTFNDNTTQQVFSSREVAALFERWFFAETPKHHRKDSTNGKGSQGAVKRLAPWMLDLPDDLAFALLQGLLDSDGHWRQNDGRCSLALVSPHLAQEAALLAAQLGFAPNVRKWKKERRNASGKVLTRGVWEVDWQRADATKLRHDLRHDDEGHVWCPVVNVKHHDSDITVHDLGVPGDHSFVAAGVAVHNCFGRINDAHGLIADHLIIEGSIDEMFLDIIDEKRAMAAMALDGEEAEAIMNHSIMGDVLVKLAERQ